jgi:hypothetical protein
MTGIGDGRLGDDGHLAGDHLHLFFGVVVAPPQPGGRLLGGSPYKGTTTAPRPSTSTV